jgi:hypothetical protein
MSHVDVMQAIGLIVAAYVIFRSAESLLHLGKGGTHQNLAKASQLIIGLLALVALAAAALFGLSFLNIHLFSGLTGMPSMEGAPMRGLPSLPGPP